MTGSDLAETLARRLAIPKKDAQVLTRAFFSAVVLGCLETPRIELRRFGTFSAVRRRARPARDFKTGKTIHVPERLVLQFKAGKELLSKLNPKSSSPA